MGVLDTIKQGAGKAAFEADRRVRLVRVESNIGTLKRTMAAQVAQLGEAAYGLYRQGTLADQGLAALCDQVRQTERQVEEANREAEKIRLETVPTPVGLLFGRVCLNCQIRLPQEAHFCPRCGGPATDVVSPAAAPARTCATCGRPLAPESRFCAACGSPVPPPALEVADPAPVSAPGAVCSGCGQALAEGAVFCEACGRPVR